ncbi:opa3-like protein [Quercus suber]|uniref:Opa3-like protein n=1 Tax=Quercus suber TaxID=58331 RepID=A0AAW0L6I8_QUESU
MVLPLFKLGTLALRTVSKPIANRLKKEAGLHPTFRQFIINIAQANHRFTTTVQRRLYGHATNALIRPLDEGRAVQLASELFGELFVFTVITIPSLILYPHYLLQKVIYVMRRQIYASFHHHSQSET